MVFYLEQKIYFNGLPDGESQPMVLCKNFKTSSIHVVEKLNS